MAVSVKDSSGFDDKAGTMDFPGDDGFGFELHFCAGADGSIKSATDDDVVAVNLTPFIARWRLTKVTGAIVDLRTAIPVVVVHVVATLPILVLDVLLLLPGLIVVMVILLAYGEEWSAANAEEDACGESFLEQGVTSGWSDGRQRGAVVLAT